MPEAAAAARTWLKLNDLDQFGLRHGSDYELGDSVAGMNRDRLGPQIHKQYFNFTAIVGVDRPRRIDQRETLFERSSAARPHLSLEARRDFKRDSGRHGDAR